MTYPKQQAQAQMIFRKTGGFVQGNMTLRDHFAGLAMMGLISQSAGTALGSRVEIAAEYAYAAADAMLEERIK